MKLHHIGIACKDIPKVIDFIKKLFNVISVSNVVHDENQDADLCLIETAEGICIELVCGEKVNNLLNKGITYYHLCYSVKDLDQVSTQLKDMNCVEVSKQKEAILFNNNKVAFFYTPLGLIEFLEQRNDNCNTE